MTSLPQASIILIKDTHQLYGMNKKHLKSMFNAKAEGSPKLRAVPSRQRKNSGAGLLNKAESSRWTLDANPDTAQAARYFTGNLWELISLINLCASGSWMSGILHNKSVSIGQNLKLCALICTARVAPLSLCWRVMFTLSSSGSHQNREIPFQHN